MPKDMIVESVTHHLLRCLERAAAGLPPDAARAWRAAADSLSVKREGARLVVSCSAPRGAKLDLDPALFALYRRGDGSAEAPIGEPRGLNSAAADAAVSALAALLGLARPQARDGRLASEEAFHDEWASSVRPEEVLVHESFEACTAPEHRRILELLGDLKGKRLLDLGSGLGEASVYFALRGAKVTACDLSSGMLDLAKRVAAHHKVEIATHQAPAEKTGLPDASFDIVYAGNLLHHVNIAPTLDEARRILAPGGIFVSWDPLAHNPIIDVYRFMAGGMRTPDEHPLSMKDLDLFRARFCEVRWDCFWFFTLAVFVRFYLEGAHPSKQRYWKKILKEAARLEPFHSRLESWDRRLLRAFPWLGRYCWNIVIWARKPA